MSIRTLKTDVLIVGAGPAGLTAGLYVARAGKKAVVLEGRSPSRLGIPYTIENYPGVPSVSSLDLLGAFRKQALSFGAEVVAGDAIAFMLDGAPKYVTTKDAMIEAGAVILATGKPVPKARMIPGEDRLVGQGVSYCATCDGPLFRGRTVAAVGSGPEALEDVHALLEMGCRVVWVPGKAGEAADGPEARALEGKGADIRRGAKVKEIRGDNVVESVVVEGPSGLETVPVPAVFVFREVPAGPLFEKAGLAIDHKQCLAVDRFQRTNLAGVFAAGDITCGGLQVVAAAGEGCVAALQALAYLRK
ncbi:MAG TPA: FAD-dependent oxidoreductase [Candidatus Aminicenantes bacterium]|nr:FAD-dependent oxidoreductase [Candidatus Aminicenantes bacterium]